MSSDLPFRVEYAKSGRAGCKGCKMNIPKDELRMAAMVQSAFHDGKQPNWFHYECFWRKQRPASEGDMEGFANLRYEDQKKIRQRIEEMGGASGVVAPTNGKGSGGKKGKKRTAAEANILKDFGVEYAASGRARCRGCEINILKDEVRIKKVVYDTEVGMKYGGEPCWHHIDCFAKLRAELGYFESGDKLPGFKTLSKEDQKRLKEALPVSTDIPAAKKVKKEEEDTDEVDMVKASEKIIEKQQKALFKIRDRLKNNLHKNELVAILEANKQAVPVGNDQILDKVADIVVFGNILPCPKCAMSNECEFIFTNTGYKCQGSVTEWAKCENVVKEPVRVPTKIPKALKDKHEFLKDYKSVVSKREIRYVPPSGKTYAQAGPSLQLKKETEGPKIQRERPPLYQMEFVILGNTKLEKDDIKERIRQLGGKVVTKIHERTMAIISNEHEVERMGARMSQAKEFNIQVVTDDIVAAMEKKKTGACEYIQSQSICDWGTDPSTRAKTEDEMKSKSKSLYTKSVPSKVNVKLKGGTAVDPDSGLDDKAHVYKEGKNVWNAVLGLTDIQSGKNSYYKLQILEADKGNRYWLFRSWGRIGTTIGGTKTEDCNSLFDAMELFKRLYEEKSGNMWDFRHDFQKIPGKMYPIDIDYGQDEQTKALDTTSKIKSELPTPVQNLIKLIFDVDAMKKTMMEFELDMEKMPLGRLSKHQLKKAYAVLTELSDFVVKGASNALFIDASNRFYTLVPHSFGTEMPTVLDTLDMITSKIQMLDSLMEIELAYSMLNEDTEKGKNPIDGHYEQLKAKLVPLNHESDEFKTLVKYVQNTHAETHNKYELIVEDIFTVDRSGENKRYKPFRKLANRKLLWHGSRLTNFAGILSHGLKIAPPEAPATGYMFGKGIYFADMVSKSANYCFTSPQNNTGLVMLCEVALGNMKEYSRAHYVEKLPSGCHSAKGLGQTFPDPSEAIIDKDGVEIPLGKPMKDDKLKSDLLYNEYIVYDVAQVNCKYLLKLKFNYKY